MGAALSAPVELISVQRSGNEHYSVGVADMQGWRNAHEDAHFWEFAGGNGVFGVLDGHGGDQAAITGASALQSELIKECGENCKSLPSTETVEGIFEKVDRDLQTYFQANTDKASGSTVISAVARKCADDTFDMNLLNAGDSRGLVVRCGKQGENGVIASATIDHKPDRPDERKRIVDAGGFVSEDNPARLDGNLAVSRGLGDFEYKKDSKKPAGEQKCSCIPEVYEVNGLKEGDICILCCDGIWDVMSNEEVVEFVESHESPDDPGEIAADLVSECLRKNSRDNMTVMIVKFTRGTEFAECEDEMKCWEKMKALKESTPGAEPDAEVKKAYENFLKRKQFTADMKPCDSCDRWYQKMQQCPCKTVCYCSKACQKKGWKQHKLVCPAVVSQSPASEKGGKSQKKKK